MDNNVTFEQVFRYRFNKNWALRNILVNYFVYWRGGGIDPRADGINLDSSVRDVHEFIKTNGVFKRGQYPGIGRMLMIENIFEEETSIKRENEADYLYPGLIPAEHVQLFESVVNKEYGLDQVLFKKPTPYIIAQFMWNVYHNKDRNGKRGRKPGSAHMLEIAKLLFVDKFPKGLEVSEKDSGIHGNFYGRYLLVKADDYCWPLFFLSGSQLIDDPVEVFNVHTAYKVSDPDTEFPTICGTYFGDNIKEYAQRNGIQLLQISSLFKFFQWVDRKRGEGITSEKIAKHLDIIPRQSEVPIPVGLAIQDIQKLI